MSEQGELRLLLRVPEVEKALAVKRTTVYRLMNAGVLERQKIGRAIRIPLQSVEAYVRANGALGSVGGMNA